MDLPQKPRYTEPCNHCGVCCANQLCDIAEMAFPGASAPCPALTLKDGKAMCGMVAAEVAAGLEPVIQTALGIGFGCSMPDATTTEKEVRWFNSASLIKLRRGLL